MSFSVYGNRFHMNPILLQADFDSMRWMKEFSLKANPFYFNLK